MTWRNGDQRFPGFTLAYCLAYYVICVFDVYRLVIAETHCLLLTINYNREYTSWSLNPRSVCTAEVLEGQIDEERQQGRPR